MGQKVNPYGFRLGVTTDWKSRWFNDREYQDYLIEDWKIRDYLMGQLERAAVSRKKRASARVAARRLIREHDLPMKVSGIDYINDRNHTTIYFTAPHRVDFRALVRDLSATLHGRVELRQLSARDEARLTGGLGSCGRELCCSTFLVDFEPASAAKSWYSGCSYFRQHINRPHAPEMRSGFSGRS